MATNLLDLATKLAGRKRPLQLESAWANPASGEGSWLAPTNPANFFYRKNPFNAEMPLYNPMEGFQWMQDTYQDPQGVDRYRYWQAPTEAAPAAAPQTPAQQAETGFARQLQADPMVASTQARLGPMPGLLESFMGLSRPQVQQQANPQSPYSFMPLMPSVPATPVQSQIGGMNVRHNLPFLSQLFPSSMAYDYAPVMAPDMMPFQYKNYMGNPFKKDEKTTYQALGQNLMDANALNTPLDPAYWGNTI